MPSNVFDKASRFAAKLDPPGFLSWLLGLPVSAFIFRGWLDTRAIPFPRDPDRTNDTVAWIEMASGDEAPWALAIEFQLRPDADMTGRLLGYLSGILLELRPDTGKGSRFQVGAAVVNLTGNGMASRAMRLPGTNLATILGVVERNLEQESAQELVRGIEAGLWSLCLLPWIPLMVGGDNPELVERWKRLAETEPLSRRKADFVALALIFAEKAGRKDLWEEKLRGWNVEESMVVNGWVALAEARGQLKGLEAAKSLVLKFASKRLGPAPAAVETILQGIDDLERLQRIGDQIDQASDWNDLLATP
jgi:hypothetical protein